MATVSDVARRVTAAIDTAAGPLLVGDWVAKRYETLVARSRFRHLRKIGELTVPGTISDGTITVARGSRDVVGDATALAAWSPELKGRWLRGSVTWYEIADVTAAGLTLASGYAENDVVAGAYTIAARVVTLAPDARWLGSFVHMRRRQPIPVITVEELDLDVPERPWATAQAGPDVVAEMGSQGGPRRVEAYPYPAQNELLHYVYWSLPFALTYESALPQEIDTAVLVEGALIDLMRWEAAKAASAGKVELAAYWRNEYRAQETAWQKWMQDAARADRGVDDVTFILQAYARSDAPVRGDIRTAHDQVYANWNS